MNEKLNIQSLVELLVARNSINKKDADVLVKEFFRLIEESLEKDKYVKIKGLGTFKLIDVDSRESVNINTGERFEIQEHTKVSFVPEASLREAINRPFSHFETVVLEEETETGDSLADIISDEEEQKDDGTAQESAAKTVDTDEIDDVSSMEIVSDSAISENSEQQQHCDELMIKEEQRAVEMDNVEEDVEPETNDANIRVEKDSANERTDYTDIEEHTDNSELLEEVDAETSDTSLPPSRKNKFVSMRYFISIAILIILLSAVAVIHMCFPNLFSNKAEILDKSSSTKVENVTNQVVSIDSVALGDTISGINKNDYTETEASKKGIAKQKTNSKDANTTKGATDNTNSNTANVASIKSSQKSAAFEPDSVNYNIVGTKTTYTISEGETLTRIALRFYGTKALWPYLVKHNPLIIKNPDRVPCGTTINIPILQKKDSVYR